jgi:phosphoglycolate phosphatase-like HAD superfamily hydrolase
LRAHLAGRRNGLASGAIAPDAMLLTGAQPMLEALASRGVAMALASGTDDPDVREEAEVLGVARFFGPRIYGAKDDYAASGKKRVVERLLAASGIAGRDLLVFGDGFVEIECVKTVGGYAVGVASDEAAGGGRINAWKRERLLGAGADMIVPDFAGHARLAQLLLGP